MKYVHKGLGFEIIFDKNGKRVTTPENIGTLNYGPDPWQPAHWIFDILPLKKQQFDATLRGFQR